MIWGNLQKYKFKNRQKETSLCQYFVYLLLAALHVSTPFLGQPQAHINIDASYWVVWLINKNLYLVGMVILLC
jgi:hypothetical protein